MRHFIRHPVDIPLSVQRADTHRESHFRAIDLSAGGLSFDSNDALAPGQRVAIKIETAHQPFDIHGTVVWCLAVAAGEGDPEKRFRIGVCFHSAEETYALRMVEQICHIEQYRAWVSQREGRDLSAEQAAAEWIQRHAGDFPPWDSEGAAGEDPH